MTTATPIELLLKTNVNAHTEKKNNLTYLSWAWAWAEALKADAEATFSVQMFGEKCFMEINGTAMVWVTVTMFGKPMTCMLPVMNPKNEPISVLGRTFKDKWGNDKKEIVDSFNVNTAIMRCMTKALALHGLGLYIYSGEDLPEGEVNAADQERLQYHLTTISQCDSHDTLKAAYLLAYSEFKHDKEAQNWIIEAKDAKKASL